MYRLIVESLLGVQREGARLRIAPCLPPDRPGFTLRYRHGGSMYRIAVARAAIAGESTRLTVDGVEQDGDTLALLDDGRHHDVQLRLPA
jgi:cellobiose phosphorylase